MIKNCIMWLSLPEGTSEAWFSFEPLTILYPYKSVQKKTAMALAPYTEIVRRYSELAKQPVSILSSDVLEQQPEILEENVALLKNAIELWRTSTKVSDAIAPILYHYSWHCFNSFFAYSFFKWEPRHTSSHGIGIKLSDHLEEISLKISEQGLFRRLVDTWTIIGVPLVFSRYLPIVKDDRMEFTPNERYLPDQNGNISLRELVEFSPQEFERSLNSEKYAELVKHIFLSSSVHLPNSFLQSYLLLFVASSLARYRPILWHSILAGKSQEESDFYLASSDATLDYTIGRDFKRRSSGLVSQIAQMLTAIERRMFILRKGDGTPIKEA